MSSVLIRNIGALVSGDLAHPLIEADAIYIEDGLFREVGSSRTDADTVIDANGLTVTPGLVDSHVHPTFGDHTPVANSVGWIRAYLHGSGTTTMVSAGEQHLPGLPYDPPDPQILLYEAIVARKLWSAHRPGGVKVRAGTLLAVPGFDESSFDQLAQAGCTNVKFIFYPFHKDPDEGRAYIKWSRARGITTKVHSGGVSRSGVSQPAFAEEIEMLQPDVVGHITGGPIAMSAKDMERVITETKCWLEVVSGANYRRNYEFYEMVKKHKAWDRVIFGTDTPSGAGIMPRGMLRNLLFPSGINGLPPEEAICMASGSVAKAHGLDVGIIATGRPADVVIMGHVQGSVATSALESIAQGDLPGISCILVDGKLIVRDRAEQTPPPERIVRIEKEPR
ncbi:MAG TPA: amidohydrolase family protein [Candidatus Limnocylindria bacterium]|nr:amidohydrolase family protein [Candidatus Limnocylindria bacterium]